MTSTFRLAASRVASKIESSHVAGYKDQRAVVEATFLSFSSSFIHMAFNVTNAFLLWHCNCPPSVAVTRRLLQSPGCTNIQLIYLFTFIII